MAIAASGLYGPTLEKALIGTLGGSLESETAVRCALVQDAYTPDFNVHDFWDDVSANEAAGTGYTAGGALLTATEVTLAAGVLTYDAADVSWPSSTITAKAAVGFIQVGADLTTPADDQLVFLSNFGADASTSNGTFTVQWAAGGIFTIDYTP